MTNPTKITSVLRATIPAGGKVQWKDIMAAITAAGIAVTNWMVVRNLLQELIDSGFCQRWPSVIEEAYTQDVFTAEQRTAAIEAEKRAILPAKRA